MRFTRNFALVRQVGGFFDRQGIGVGTQADACFAIAHFQSCHDTGFADAGFHFIAPFPQLAGNVFRRKVFLERQGGVFVQIMEMPFDAFQFKGGGRIHVFLRARNGVERFQACLPLGIVSMIEMMATTTIRTLNPNAMIAASRMARLS